MGMFDGYDFGSPDDPAPPLGILGRLAQKTPNLPPPTQVTAGFPPLPRRNPGAAMKIPATQAGPQAPLQITPQLPATAEPQNPFMSLLGGIGNGISSLLGGTTPPSPAAADQQALLTPRGAGLLDRLTAGAANLTTGGNPIAGLVNSINGLATGQRTDRAGIEFANQQATMLALMNAGVDAVTARAAATNPDYLKALMMAWFAPTARPQPAGPRPAASAPTGATDATLGPSPASETVQLYRDRNGQYQIVPR